jgi:uncharacterized protein (TIGR02996 family)
VTDVTTATHPDLLSFLHSIRETPDDDMPRLALADWLDEQPTVRECPECKNGWEPFVCKVCGNGPDDDGCLEHGKGCYVLNEDGGGCESVDQCANCDGTGSITDTSDSERAELIRVQVELTRQFPHVVRDPGFPNNAARWKRAGAYSELRARESALLQAHPDWLPPCPVCRGDCIADYGTVGADSCYHCGDLRASKDGTGRVGSFARGLLVVPVPNVGAVWKVTPNHRMVGPRDWVELTPWARDLRERYPWVTEMPVGDREPHEWNGYYFWYDDRRDMTLPFTIGVSHYLPAFIYDRIQWQFDLTEATSSLTTADLARRALARAVARGVFAANADGEAS